MATPKTPARAIARRTVTMRSKHPSKSRKDSPSPVAAKKRPMITVNVLTAESMLLIVIPGYHRLALATAYAIMSRILIGCEDGNFDYLEGYRIGPGDRLKTCTSIEVQARTGFFFADARIMHVGRAAFPATCDALATMAGRGQQPAYDATLVIHSPGVGR